MSVVIHDFEIIPDGSGEDADGEEPAADSAPEATSIRPVDVVEIVNRDERRRRRLRAH
ncbi:MAG: hypothetical protein ABEL97_05115 [Salinibacter sp.]